MDTPKEELATSVLPLSRIKTIMKSSPDTSSISQEALFLTGKATEMFIETLARFSEAHARGQKDRSNSLEYGDLAEIVNTEESLSFLQDIIPRKITGKQFEELQKQRQKEEEEEEES